MECVDLRNQVHWIQRKLLMTDSHHNDVEVGAEQQPQLPRLPTAAGQLLPDQPQTAALVVSPEGSYLNEGVGSGSNAEIPNPKEHGIKQEVTSPTPEPRSLHSSPAHAHKTRRLRSRKGRSRHQAKGGAFRGGGGGGFEPPETFGTFTSAAPTPDSQRNILLESPEGHMREQAEEVEEEEDEEEDEEEEKEQELNPQSEGENLDIDSNLETVPRSQQQSHNALASTQFIESDSRSKLNTWGLYQAVRLLQLKNRLMLPVIQFREKNKTSEKEEENT